MELSIIIVNFNVKYFLEQCLCSVLNATKNIAAEIIVIDNNSSDDSRPFLEKGFSDKVTFIWSEENLGFSKANNLALKQAIGKFVLFLNPDTILSEDCLEKSLVFFNRQQNAGAMGIRMIDGSGDFLKESKRAFPSPITSLCKLSGLTALFPTSKFFARYYLGHLDQHRNHEVEVLAGAFMLVKKEVLDKTGYFDERFFLYGEDIDLSYRIKKAGYKNLYFSESTILHFKGESMKKGSFNYIRLFYGAMVIFVKKHYNAGFARFYNWLILAAIWVKAVFFGLGHLLNPGLKNKKEDNYPQPCVIIADKSGFGEIMFILLKNNLRQEVAGRISPGQVFEKDALGTLQQLKTLIAEYKVKELIFCLNGITAKEILELIQQLPAGMHFRFHFPGSSSIVGSKFKGSSGDSIAID